MKIGDIRELLKQYPDGYEAEFFFGNIGTREVDVTQALGGSVVINVAIPNGYLLVAKSEWDDLQHQLAVFSGSDVGFKS